MERWVLAVVWATLPVTAGGAIADATSSWSDAPQVVAALLCWAAWGTGLLAIVVARPVGLTAIRVIAPDFAVLAIVVAVLGDVGTTGATVAIAATLVAAVLASRPALAFAAANAAAYGDEERFPLRVPPALFLGPLPAARLLVGAAVATGPLLIADERWVAGAVALLVAMPVLFVGGRALHGLSARWVILVPAGFVVADPLTLADPVLFLREHIASLRAIGPAAPRGEGIADLRLGASLGSLLLTVDQTAELFRSRRTRRGAATIRATSVCVAALSTPRLLARARERRIPVVLPTGHASGGAGQTATPPPTSSAPS